MAFSFNSVGHFFATVAHDIKAVGAFLAAHKDEISKDAQVAVNLFSLVDPKLAPIASQIERASEAALGEVLAVIDKAGDAVGANGINIQLDKDLAAEFKTLLDAIKKIKPEAASVPTMILTAAAAQGK